MYNLRYHIASLVAVFLALALGLVLGGIVVERGTLDAQRTALVDSLRSDFNRLTKENRSLRTQLGLISDFSDSAAKTASAGRLSGKRVVVLTNSGRSDGLQATRAAIEAGGGSVTVAVVQRPGLGLDDAAVRDALASKVGSDTPTDIGEIGKRLASEWATGAGERPVTEALTSAGALRVDELPAGTGVDAMAIIALADGKPDESALKLGQAFQAAGRPAAGVQLLDQATGIAAAAAELGLGAVNDADTAPGQWSLVELLSGGPPAYYGVGTEVDAAFPPLPPAQQPTTGTVNP